MQDELGEVSPQSYLEERFGLTDPFIVEKTGKSFPERTAEKIINKQKDKMASRIG